MSGDTNKTPSPPPAADASSSTNEQSASGQPAKPVKNLELTLSGRDLIELPVSLIASHSADIVKLDLSDNRLVSLATLPPLSRVHTLILDKNRLMSLASLPASIPSLRTLWVNNNQCESLTDLVDTLVEKCPNLTYLSALRNLCVPDMYHSESEADAYQRYRYYVIHRLPALTILDATSVSKAERELAREKGPYSQVARPNDTNGASGSRHTDSSSSSQASSSSGSNENAIIGAVGSEPAKAATFIAKGKPRYDGANSEGNRFIVNDDL